MKKAYFFIRKLRKAKIIWTQEEDEILIKNGFNCKSKADWEKLSINFNKKTRYKCFRRYSLINPNMQKGRFTKSEDSKLIKFIEVYGKNWNLISNLLGNRTPKQVKNRYENNLNPLIKKEHYTKEDDKLIMELFDIFENKWSKYQNYFPTRSLKSIKNRFLKINFSQKPLNWKS